MSKYGFTIGQKLQRIENDHAGVKVGDIVTYRADYGSSDIMVDECSVSLSAERFIPLVVTKAQRLIAAKEAELARLKEAAAKRANDAAERKAKAERAKTLAGLSAAGKRVVAMLQAGAASDFGCQRNSVILLAAAITGDKADAIKKALA